MALLPPILARPFSAGKGAVPTFVPSDLGADLYAWWDLSALAYLYQDSGRTTPCTAAADPVGSVTDRSGNSRHLSQGTAGFKPAVVSGGSSVGYCARFDGVDDYLSRAAVNLGAKTIYLAGKITSATGSPLHHYQAATYQTHVYKPTGWTFRHAEGVLSNADNGAAWPGTSSKTRMAWVCRNGSSPYSQWFVDDSATSVLDLTTDPTNGGVNGTLFVGAYTGGILCAGLDLFEALVCNSAHNAATRANVFSYLARH